MLDKTLLDILICPRCKGSLTYDATSDLLVCKAEALAYPVRDGIPILLIDEATSLNASDLTDSVDV